MKNSITLPEKKFEEALKNAKKYKDHLLEEIKMEKKTFIESVDEFEKYSYKVVESIVPNSYKKTQSYKDNLTFFSERIEELKAKHKINNPQGY